MAGFVYMYSTFTLPETQKMNFSKAKAVASVVISSNRDRARISSVASVLKIWLMLST